MFLNVILTAVHYRPLNPEVREGYKILAPGASVAVDALWLHSALSSVRGQGRGQSLHFGQHILYLCKFPLQYIKHLTHIYSLQCNDKSFTGAVKKRPQKPESVIKHLMDGFFTLHDLTGKGGTGRFLNSPVYMSLKCKFLLS